MIMQRTIQNTYTVTETLSECLKKKITFAAYRLPASSHTTVIIQNDNDVREIEDPAKLSNTKGFLIAPFYSKGPIKNFLIRPDIVVRNLVSPGVFDTIKQLKPGSVNSEHNSYPYDVSKEEFVSQVEKVISSIKKGEFEKLVLSRLKTLKKIIIPELPGIFKSLCESDPNTFVYLFRINGHCWAGATPEPLLCCKDNKLTTVSLAGTRTYSDENLNIDKWNKKEIVEQKYVTNHIERILGECKILHYKKEGPFIKQAGQLLHLCTEFAFQYSDFNNSLSGLIKALHPTAAVCGFPVQKALDFILKTEKHTREYYTGYLGPVGIDDCMQLFVNLRCMKVYDDSVNLFIGSGITEGSVPEQEWEETEYKAETLLSVIGQVQQ